MIYRFRDTDSTGREEYDIEGDEYQSLLDICFRYCDSVSFIVRIDPFAHDIFPPALDKHQRPQPMSIENVYSHYGMNGQFHKQDNLYEVRCYQLSDEVQQYLRVHVHSMFEWINGWGNTNLEDPAFFRSDGSVFFQSIIHEGECFLLPNDNEDISCVIKNPNWSPIQDNRVP